MQVIYSALCWRSDVAGVTSERRNSNSESSEATCWLQQATGTIGWMYGVPPEPDDPLRRFEHSDDAWRRPSHWPSVRWSARVKLCLQMHPSPPSHATHATHAAHVTHVAIEALILAMRLATLTLHHTAVDTLLYPSHHFILWYLALLESQLLVLSS